MHPSQSRYRYLLRSQSLEFVPGLGHQLPNFQYLMSQDMENSKDCLRLLQANLNVSILDPTRAYSWSPISQLPIVQSIRLIPLEQPNFQYKGLIARAYMWSPAKPLWGYAKHLIIERQVCVLSFLSELFRPGKGTKRRPNRVCASEDYLSAWTWGA